MSPSALAELIARHDGIVRSRTLRAAGASRRDLQRAVDAGAVLRVREGVYAAPTVLPVLLEAARHGGEVACASALRARGVWVLDEDTRVHVWVGSHGRRLEHAGCHCVTHRDGGRSAFGGVRITHALVQLASCLGDEAFFAAFESAWRLGMLSRTDRAEVRAGLRARQRWLVDVARADADSGLESLLRLRLLRLGIRMDAQVGIPTVGRVDFVIEGRLILEADGRPGHAREAERHKDLLRDARAAALGYETLRFDYAMIIHDWPTVQAAIMTRLSEIRRAGRRTSGAAVIR